MPTFDDIKSNFELLDDWEDRYRYVIELGRQLPSLALGAKTDTNKVRGCASQVWLIHHLSGHAGLSDRRLSFEGESDSHIVQGLIAILLTLANDTSPDELLALDIPARFASLGLKEHLTPQRSNGLASMIDRIRSDARSALLG